MNTNTIENAIVGCLLGAAVGDALGLPMEGLSRRRQLKMFPDINGYHLLFGRGMVSDDTEHICMVARSLLDSGGEEELFGKLLARRMKIWLAFLPAGVGFATLRAILKLWLGFSPLKSGVFSAGNGPAMRSAIIGILYGNNPDKLRRLVKISTRITHTDPKAEYGALAVALAAHMSALGKSDPEEYFQDLNKLIEGDDSNEFLGLIQKTVQSVQQGNTTESFADSLGLIKGVTGYMYHTAPVVIHSWLTYPNDLQSALEDVIRLGGDTDTTASILGGILGAGAGKAGINQKLLDDLVERPLSVSYIEKLGQALARYIEDGEPQQAPGLPLIAIPIRNLFFLTVVLTHGLRRLLPPY